MSDLLPHFMVILAALAAPVEQDGWKPAAPRDEIRPAFSIDPTGRPAGKGAWVIQSAKGVPQHGAWVKRIAIEAGRHYRFTAFRKATGVACPRRSCVVKITWQDAKGRGVQAGADQARPSYPTDGDVTKDGWTEVSDVYAVPAGVAWAAVELQLRWAPGGKVAWAEPRLEKVPPPKPRKVRLAAVHYVPRGGKSPADNRKLFTPLIAEAAKKKADLVVLGECITKVGNGASLTDAAEPVPGPSTKFFGQLARKHHLYIVVGLIEREGPLIYNTAAMLGPDGKLAGKYRKVCLPREEIRQGTTPGEAYPVFETRFGKVGMMVCWDVFFPEVARRLAAGGAEVIAMPIWGGSPDLARARAIENQVYLVTSTYTDPKTHPDWMKSGVWDHKGKLLVEGKKWGTVVVAEVDLDARTHWWWLGDFKARIPRERPPR